MIGGEYGLSGGVLPMMKIYNDTIVAFNQRGKRKGLRFGGNTGTDCDLKD